jgi:hypothetical protein
MNYLIFLLFGGAAALVLFALFQWLRDRRAATPPRFRFESESSPDRRQFGETHTPNSRVGHAAQRGKEVFRPLLDVPAPPQAGDDVPPLSAVPEQTPHEGQEFEDRRIMEDNGDAH